MIKYKPNTKLYFILLGSSFAIAFLSLLIPINSKWFTIVAGISCGGIASVIVAWILDTASCKEKNERSNNTFSMLNSSLLCVAYSFASIYQRATKMKAPNTTEKHTWIEWERALISYLKKTPEESMPKDLVTVYWSWTRLAKDQLTFILNQRIQLMSDGLMSLEFLQSLIEIRDVIEFCESEVKNKTCNEIINCFFILADTLEQFFQSNSGFESYNKIQFFDFTEFVKQKKENDEN